MIFNEFFDIFDVDDTLVVVSAFIEFLENHNCFVTGTESLSGLFISGVGEGDAIV